MNVISFVLRRYIYKIIIKIPIKKVPPTLLLKGGGMRGMRNGGSLNIELKYY